MDTETLLQPTEFHHINTHVFATNAPNSPYHSLHLWSHCRNWHHSVLRDLLLPHPLPHTGCFHHRPPLRPYNSRNGDRICHVTSQHFIHDLSDHPSKPPKRLAWPKEILFPDVHGIFRDICHFRGRSHHNSPTEPRSPGHTRTHLFRHQCLHRLSNDPLRIHSHPKDRVHETDRRRLSILVLGRDASPFHRQRLREHQFEHLHLVHRKLHGLVLPRQLRNATRPISIQHHNNITKRQPERTHHEQHGRINENPGRLRPRRASLHDATEPLLLLVLGLQSNLQPPSLFHESFLAADLHHTFISVHRQLPPLPFHVQSSQKRIRPLLQKNRWQQSRTWHRCQ